MTFGSSDDASSHRPAASARRSVPRASSRSPRPPSRRPADPRVLGVHFLAVPLRRSVRIAYDVTPLSHPRTGVGNYILGALKGMVEAADGSHELVAFGPVSIRGRRLLDATLARPPGRAAHRAPCRSRTRSRTAWSRLGRPPAERFLGDVDVLHFTDWMVPPRTAARPRDDDPRPRSAAISRATASADGAHALRHRSGGGRAATSSSPTAEYTANDVVERLGIPR